MKILNLLCVEGLQAPQHELMSKMRVMWQFCSHAVRRLLLMERHGNGIGSH
jgi:hypothetical protein